jgi:hypothetical protein
MNQLKNILLWMAVLVTVQNVAAQAQIFLIPTQDTVVVGDSVNIDIILGNEANPIDSISYLEFELTIDTTHLNFYGLKFDNYSNNFFGNEIIDYAFTLDSTNNVNRLTFIYDYRNRNRSGNGKLGRLKLIVEDDVPGIYKSIFRITNIVAHTKDMYPIELVSQDSYVFLSDKLALSSPLNTAKYPIKLFPNPTKNIIQIENKNIEVEVLEVYDLSGKIVYQGTETTIDFSPFAEGTYLLIAYTRQGYFVQKVVKTG